MKRWILALVFAAMFVQIASPVLATRKRAVHHGPRRTAVVVHKGFPIRRAFPEVVVRPARVVVRVAPAVFLAPLAWRATVVAAPAADVLIWQDGETLEKEADWTEFTLSVNGRGRALYLEILGGKAQIQFAEVVFENGEAQVVDFKEATEKPGFYALLDFADGRKVDHVRMVARAKDDETRIVLKLAK
jgi:hypothetical protein